MSDLVKSAEALFEVKTVPEIRQIEEKTRADIENKKKQLRQLVGDSYRDLIESADKVVSISNSCTQILSHVNDVQRGFAQLGRSITSADTVIQGKRDTLTAHEQLYGVGKRVKYLVDTPEMIWGCLDSKQYLEAARRFLRAQEVHNLLKELFPAEILSKFPLVTHQWPLVLKFKAQLVTTVSTSLSSDAALTTAQCADALAAVAALESLDTLGSLQAFLSARRTWVQNQLQSHASQEQISRTAVTSALCELAQVLQTTISQVADLFLPTSRSAEATCLLQSVTKEDEMDSSELLFGGETQQLAGSSAEAEAWQLCVKAIQGRLTVLAASQIEHACQKWLKNVVEDVNALCPSLLRNFPDATSLCEVEAAIVSMLTSWQRTKAKSKSSVLHNITNSITSSLGSLRSLTSGISMAPEPSTAVEAWDSLCEAVLGKSISLWQEVFFVPFMIRAKELIGANFEAIVKTVQEPLQTCFDLAVTANPEAVGEVWCPQWPQQGTFSAQCAPPSRSYSNLALAATSCTSPHDPKNHNTASAGFRFKVQEICRHFDDQLKGVLQMVLLLLGTAEADRGELSPGSMNQQQQLKGASMSGRRDTALRASELEPYAQQKCMELIIQLATTLQGRLSALGPAANNPAGASTAEQALLIGRTASALATESKFLAVIMGPPENWRGYRSIQQNNISRAPSLRYAALGKVKVGPGNARLLGMVEQLQGTAAAAYRIWAKWAAACLALELQHEVLQSDMLFSPTVPLSWVETVVAAEGQVEGTLDEVLQDMRFSLPGCPSGYMLSILSKACQEARRAGDHTIGIEALQVYEWELAGALLNAFKALLQPGGAVISQITDRGILQLLMDVRFMRDVLAGGRPLSSKTTPVQAGADGGKALLAPVLDWQDPEVNTALSERRREAAALEAQLQDQLDPIDWATYEPYLWANVQKYYQRVAIMFGTLIQLHRAYPDASGKVQMMQEINALNVLPVAPRFQYLPITAPASQSLQNRAAPGLANLSKTNGAGSGSSDFASDYSFTDVGSARLGTSLLSHKDASNLSSGQTIAEPGSGSAFSSLQAKLGNTLGNTGTSFSTFGSILGDKAAEMTAMAQQKFGDIGDFLPTSALGSASGLFNQLTKGVGRK